jgi:threonine synthase
MATAIRIGSPASWKKALRILDATGGTVEQVSEVEIALAKAEIGADGIGCEPASPVTLAGLKKLVKQGFVKSNESVVLVLTGHVLKDPDFTLKFHRGDLFQERPSSEADFAARSAHRLCPMPARCRAQRTRAGGEAEPGNGQDLSPFLFVFCQPSGYFRESWAGIRCGCTRV